VTWDELSALTGGDTWTVATAGARLDLGNTPWDGYQTASANIEEALEMLELPARGYGSADAQRLGYERISRLSAPRGARAQCPLSLRS
jgi:hypothetical protein